VLDEHARQAGSACDERTIDARRSDALVDLVLDPTGMASEVTNATREDSTDESNAVARDLAAGGTWRRILTDPASGRRRHHQVKQSPSWSVTQHPDGCITWRTPAPTTTTPNHHH
jgi:hypothetical protein